MRVTGASRYVVVLMVVASASAGQPELIGETLLMKIDSRYYGLPWSVRLSPDGERLLSTRAAAVKQTVSPRPGAGEGRAKKGTQLVLREWRTGREAAIPGPLLTDAFATHHSMIPDPFSADGKLVVVPAGIDRDGDGLCVAGKEEIQPAVYHVETGKLRRVAVRGFRMFATFDAAGKHLISTVAGKTQPMAGKTYVAPVGTLKPTVLSSWGVPLAARPGGSTLALMQIIVPPDGGTPAPKFVLYDFVKDAKVADIPFETSTMPPFFVAKWTSDGRYLYYLDVQPRAAGEGDRPRSQTGVWTRVWDVQEGKEVVRLPDWLPIGPCSGATTMVLSKAPQGIGGLAFLHDARTQEAQPLTGSTCRCNSCNRRHEQDPSARIHPINTSGKYLIYDRKNERGEHLVCRAEIETRPK